MSTAQFSTSPPKPAESLWGAPPHTPLRSCPCGEWVGHSVHMRRLSRVTWGGQAYSCLSSGPGALPTSAHLLLGQERAWERRWGRLG